MCYLTDIFWKTVTSFQDDMENAQGYLMHGLCFHKTSNLMEKIDLDQKELSCTWKINATRKLGGGYFSSGTEGRDNIPEKCRADTWLCRETVQLEAAAGRRVWWGQSPSACTMHDPGEPAPLLVAAGRAESGRTVWLLSFLCPAWSGWDRAANTERPAQKSEPHSGFGASPQSVFCPQWALK